MYLYNDKGVRDICHGIKSRDKMYIDRCVCDMLNAKVVRKDDILIPVPQHEGRAIYTLKIANGIAREVGAKVCNILRSGARKSLFETKKCGKIYIPRFYKIGTVCGKRIVLIDNVIDTGVTIRSCMWSLGVRNIIALAYARVGR